MESAQQGDYLRVESLSKKFVAHGNYAFKDISFSIEKGQFVALIGPSGCGKSTLLHIASGLSKPTSGSVSLKREAVEGPRSDMMFVFQQYTKSIFPWKTVLENVFLALKYTGRGNAKEAEATCLKYLGLVGLEQYRDFYPYQLSGGMQQRVAIARSLVRQPDVLLMDEPFSALDAMMRVELQDLLLRIWKEFGLTIVFVTHDLDEALYLAQRIIVLGRSPGHIKEVIDVPIAYPRDQIETRSNPTYLELRAKLYDLMSSQPKLVGH